MEIESVIFQDLDVQDFIVFTSPQKLFGAGGGYSSIVSKAISSMNQRNDLGQWSRLKATWSLMSPHDLPSSVGRVT